MRSCENSISITDTSVTECDEIIIPLILYQQKRHIL